MRLPITQASPPIQHRRLAPHPIRRLSAAARNAT
jgi:hypothetical protein